MGKSLLQKTAVALAALTVSATATAGSFATPRFAAHDRMPQLRTFNPGIFAQRGATANFTTPARMAADKVLPSAESVTYLLAPDGSVWYATIHLDTETIDLPGGMATEDVIKGWEITVYDSLFKEVGKVKDTYVLAEDETKIAKVQPDMALTQKFFNTDTKYEIIVTVFCNTASYNVKSHSLVYSLGGATDESGNTETIAEYPGYVIDSDNFAVDRFSENYLVTFMEEISPASADDYDTYEEFLDAYKMKLTTYTKAGWNKGPAPVLEVEIGQNYLPGDGMTAPFFMTTRTADGKPAFVTSRYEKGYFANNLDFSDTTPSADNHLLVDVYTMKSVTASTAEKQWSASIDMELPAAGDLAKYYGIGQFAFTDDVNFSDYTTDGEPAFIVTVSDLPAADPDNPIPSFYVYNLAGVRTMTLAERADAYSILSDVKGENKQAMFVKQDDNGFLFDIVDVVTGQLVVEIPTTLDGHGLTTAFDRVSVGGKTYYVSSLSDHIEDGDGVTYELVGWINTDGSLDHVDQLNLGADVMYAQVNINAYTLNPYLFDTDADMEYMALVKRSRNDGTTATDEVLLVADPKSAPIFEAAPSDEYGVVKNISVFNADTTPTLYLLYCKDYSTYTQHLWQLPLSKFAGGEGTAENPYLVSTIADLQQIKGNPSACYKLVNDIDASGFDFAPIATFSGALDGDDHTISNLVVSSAYNQAVFSTTEPGAKISNLVFGNPVVGLTGDASTAAILVGTGMGVTIDNVQVYGLKATSEEFDGDFGSIAGMVSNESKVTGCFVAGADIDLPEASVGGVVNELRTSSSVKASAFNGVINAGSTVGGIVATGGTGFSVEDCHVDADIVAQNTVGGVVGMSTRGNVNRNVVEGTIEANKPGMWTSIGLGGVVGMLAQDYTQYEEGVDIPKVVTNNIVALASMTVPATGEPEFPNQHDTAHRIVGYSSANTEPEVIGYDDDWNPIFSDEPAPDDKGLADNYVIGALAPVSGSIADDPSTTEGKSLSDDEFGREFLEGLGYVYGTETAAPWSELAISTPYLHFEQKIFVPQTEFAVSVGETFTVNIDILTRGEIDPEELIGDFLCDYNEELLAMGDMGLEGNVLSLGFTCLKEGVSDITIGLMGSSAKVKVYGKSGIASVETDGVSAISFDGENVSCAAAEISIYNLAGVKVAAGFSQVSVSGLVKGVYVVSATTPYGKAVAKIAVK